MEPNANLSTARVPLGCQARSFQSLPRTREYLDADMRATVCSSKPPDA
jgi:hypothetical protein